MVPAETPTGFLRIAHRDLLAAWDDDEEPDVESLDRVTWNQRCAERRDHVTSLRP
jgi:hypothetical protein